jgi:DNA-binding MarR family transcriptional regulator
MAASSTPTPPAADADDSADVAGAADLSMPGVDIDFDFDIDLDMEVVARFRVAIARVSRQLRQQAGAGLSPTLHSMLITIAVHGPLSLSELAAREQVAPPTVTKVLAKLDDQGLVEKERGPTDRRVTLVSLTEAGTARLEESRTRRTAWLVRRLIELRDVDPQRLADAVELLEAIVQPDHAFDRPAPDRPAPDSPAPDGATS